MRGVEMERWYRSWWDQRLARITEVEDGYRLTMESASRFHGPVTAELREVYLDRLELREIPSLLKHFSGQNFLYEGKYLHMVRSDDYPEALQSIGVDGTSHDLWLPQTVAERILDGRMQRVDEPLYELRYVPTQGTADVVGYGTSDDMCRMARLELMNELRDVENQLAVSPHDDLSRRQSDLKRALRGVVDGVTGSGFVRMPESSPSQGVYAIVRRY